MRQITVTFNVSDGRWERLERLIAEAHSAGLFESMDEAALFDAMMSTGCSSLIDERLASAEGLIGRSIERKRREAQVSAATEGGER